MKLVGPAREHPSPPKLVEPDRDEGAVRVETTPSTTSRLTSKTSVPWHRLEPRKQAHPSETPCQGHVPFNDAPIAPETRNFIPPNPLPSALRVT